MGREHEGEDEKSDETQLPAFGSRTLHRTYLDGAKVHRVFNYVFVGFAVKKILHMDEEVEGFFSRGRNRVKVIFMG